MWCGFARPPIDDAVLRSFVQALRQEYVQGRQDAVGQFFCSPSGQSAGSSSGLLERVEDKVRSMCRNLDSAQRTINDLEREWLNPLVGRDQSAARQHLPTPSSFDSTPRPPLDNTVISAFIEALREEYILGSQKAVGRFYDSPRFQAAVAHSELLDAVEGKVRVAMDKHRAIGDLQNSWMQMPLGAAGYSLPTPSAPPEEAALRGDASVAATSASNQTPSTECIVCAEQPVAATFVHGSTGHSVCCFECAQKIERGRGCCPVCNLRIEKVIRSFT